jgi:hypothetical protein
MMGLLIGSLAPSVPAAESGQAFLWTGRNWQQVSEEGKAGYIFGMGNLADFETAATQGKKTACVSRAFVDDLKSRTVRQIVQEVDTFYKDNPGKLDTPVIEVVLRRCTKICPPGSARGKDKQ